MARFGPREALTLRAGAAAACLATSGVVHITLVGDHHQEAWWLGAAFLSDGVAMLFAAGRLIRRPSDNAWRLAGVVCGATVLAYCLSRVLGLPGSHREAWDALGLATTAAEVFVLIASFRLAGRPAVGRRLVPAALAVTVLGGLAYAAAPPHASDPFERLNPVTAAFLRDMLRHGHLSQQDAARYARAAR